MHKFAIGVFGASGYAGRERCELVARHPAAGLAFATANDRQGTHARFGGQDVRFVAAEDAKLGEAQLIFSALPQGASAPWVNAAHAAGAKVVDLSADLRPGNGADPYERSTLGVPYGLTDSRGRRCAKRRSCPIRAVIQR